MLMLIMMRALVKFFIKQIDHKSVSVSGRGPFLMATTLFLRIIISVETKNLKEEEETQ